MSSCKNIVILIGHVGNSPETLEDNITSVKFHLYTNKSFYSNKKQKFIQTSERHLIKAWKQNAEYSINNITKGDYVWIEGEIHYHIINLEDRKIINTEIIANNIIKLNKKSFFLEQKIEDFKKELINLNNEFNTKNNNLPDKYQTKFDDIIPRM